ncbi:unnamed protein product [Caenorhabditis bovis]|uniref:C2H2-type domain-containing protein n=1 Tax=Caenorhabditis bovis TaxID=2654633 RepID=A0A8S1E5D1_9PELO|nr:unnamed protein product [Caenorhabditis bovis]
MDPYSSSAWHSAAPPSTSVTGTSELFSSTFAMLSDNATYPEQWSAKPVTQSYLFEQPQIQPMAGSAYNDPPVRFDPPCTYRPPAYVATVPQQYYPPPAVPPPARGYEINGYHHSAPPSQLLAVPQHQFYAQNGHEQQMLPNQSSQGHVMRPEPLRPSVNNNNASNGMKPIQSGRQASTASPRDDVSLNSPALTSSGSAASGTPPLSNELAGSTDLESPDEERVMCMACRGVYPSRRSLTGHIGRNEKCREIIGRNYLDAVASGVNPPVPGTDAAIKSGAITTGQDGMSPVCPYCDRFISHYKGNIRRHINQCCKNTDAIKRPRPDKESSKNRKRRKTEDGYVDINDSYDHSMPAGGMISPSQMSPPSSSYYQSGSDLCSPVNGYSNGYEGAHALNKTEKHEHKHNAQFQDAYICEDCDFVTVYKGNMKRHLNTCHTQPECKNLRGVSEWDKKLESMRASNMGIVGEKLQEKLATHKQNSSRGRKPRKKKENQNSEESEVLIEDYKPNVTNSCSSDDYISYTE